MMNSNVQKLNAFVEFKEHHGRKRISPQSAFMAGVMYAERGVASLDDSRRLDWAINHSDAEFDVDESGCYIVTYITSGAEWTGGVAGRFIARGTTHRDCIDAFMRGEIRRID
jgi:hypothetical protein